MRILTILMATGVLAPWALASDQVDAQSATPEKIECNDNLASGVPDPQVYDACLAHSDAAGIMAGMAGPDATGETSADTHRVRAFRYALYAMGRRLQIDGEFSSVVCQLGHASKGYRDEVSPNYWTPADKAEYDLLDRMAPICDARYPDARKNVPLLLNELSTKKISPSLDRRARLEAARTYFRSRLGRPAWGCTTSSDTDSDELGSVLTFKNGDQNNITAELRSTGVVNGKTYRNFERAAVKVMTTEAGQYVFDLGSFQRVSADALPNNLNWSDPSSIRIQMVLQRTEGLASPDNAFRLRGTAKDNFGTRPFNCRIIPADKPSEN